MATIHAPTTTTRTRNAAAPDPDLFACQWEQDLRAAGVTHGPSLMIRYLVPAAAVAMLAAAALLGLAGPDAGREAAPLGLALVALAAVPWIAWLVRGDTGPSWSNTTAMMAPILALGIGHWFAGDLALGSSAAYPLLTFPVLLVVILGLAVAETRAQAIGIPAAAAIASGGPLVAAVIAGKDVNPAGVTAWHVAFALSVAAGWAVQVSYRANRSVAQAREALARQEAAEERRRIARDVHDVVAHTLSVTLLHVTAARMAVKREDRAVAVAALEEAERQGRASLADIRRMVRLLRADDATGLEAAQPGLADVDALVAGYRAAGLPVTFSASITATRQAPSAELALYRVLQEALANAARHGAGPASVDLAASDDGLRLEVGNPWPPGAVRGRGSGLAGMRERIAAAGGTVEAGVRDGRWVVRALIPAGGLA